MTRIYPTQGNTAMKPEESKVIQVENFRPRKQEAPKKARKNQHEPGLIRITLNIILIMAIMIGILSIDAVNTLPHTAMTLAVIIGSAAVMLILNQEEP